MLMKVFDKISEYLKFESGLQVIETHIWSVVNRWKTYNIDTFPFKLFKCDTKIEFYSKYWSVLAPIIVALGELDSTALSLKQRKEELILSAFPQLLSYCLVDEINSLDNLEQNLTFQIIRDTLGREKLRRLLETHIDDIIGNLTEYVSDDNHFKKSFGEYFILPKFKQPTVNVIQFRECIAFFEVSSNLLFLKL